MNRIHDAFEDLIARHPQGDPDAILASARHDATSARSRGRTRLALAAAAVVFVAAASAGAIFATGDDESGEKVHASQGSGSTTAPAAASTVPVFFTKDQGDGCKRVEQVERPALGNGPITPEQRVTAALRGLLDGPTEAETARGLTSPFHDDSSMLRSVTTANGITYIDFDRRIIDSTAAASTTCGKEQLQAELSATLSGIEGLGYRHLSIDGDSDAFYAWLGTEPPKEGPFATTTTGAP